MLFVLLLKKNAQTLKGIKWDSNYASYQYDGYFPGIPLHSFPLSLSLSLSSFHLSLFLIVIPLSLFFRFVTARFYVSEEL